MKDGFTVLRTKTNDEQREHFKERLKDRYSINITDDEYDALSKSEGVFHGAFSKQQRKTLGWIFINGTKVWVLRDGEVNRLATCYPPAIEYSEFEMLRACFSGLGRRIAIEVHKIYLKEATKVSKMKFDSVKDAAIYFFTKTKFAPLHIDKYKHGKVRTVKVAAIIDNILKGETDHVELFVRRKRQPTKPNSEQGVERSVANPLNQGTEP